MASLIRKRVEASYNLFKHFLNNQKKKVLTRPSSYSKISHPENSYPKSTGHLLACKQTIKIKFVVCLLLHYQIH